MAARLSTLQHLNIVMAGAEAERGSKLDSFVATWRHGPLATPLVDGEKAFCQAPPHFVDNVTRRGGRC